MKGLLVIPEMARAILRDVDPKTVTRRVIIPQFSADVTEIAEEPCIDKILKCVVSGHSGWWQDGHGLDERRHCDYLPGERRCLLTTWAVPKCLDDRKPTEIDPRTCDFWHAGIGPKPDWCGKSRPGRFLPNSMRYLMEVVQIASVRAERVQEITETDAMAEGVPWQDNAGLARYTARKLFSELWNEINRKRGFGWDVNPWVWRIALQKVT